MVVTNPLDQALEAHLAALSAQSEMRDAAAVRSRAVRAALDAGHTTREVAAHLGVSIRRAQAMASNTNKEQA